MYISLIAILALITLVLLLRLRIRLDFSSERKLLFAGIGRTGPQYDFTRKQGEIYLCGRGIRKFELDRSRVDKAGKTGVKERVAQAVKSKRDEPSGSKRKRSISDIARLLAQSAGALWKYFIGLLKCTIVEQAEGEIEAGFESPHLTGQAFGYYQAALAAAPGLLGRVQYIPDWTGRSFGGALRLSVAWPIYRLVWQTLLLAVRLPLMKITKMAIGKKEGVQDGE